MSEVVEPGAAPLIFVYGTLKRGFVNQPAMRGVGSDQRHVALVRGFRLFELPQRALRVSGRRVGLRPYPYPLLLPSRNAGRPVLGEIHRLGASSLCAEDALRVLDHLELEGFEYRRCRWWATSRGQRVRVWVYVYASRSLAARKHARAFPGVVWQSKKAKL